MPASTNFPARRVLLVLLFTASCALLSALGVWQLSRAETKRERLSEYQQRLAAPPVNLDDLPSQPVLSDYRWRRARVSGHYRDFHVLLDNRVQNGRVGYEVLSPFLTAAGRTVLVDRGWIALQGTRETVPELVAPADPFVIEGHLGETPTVGLDWSDRTATAEWLSPRMVRVQRVDLEALGALLDVGLWPGMIYLDADAPGALAVEWPVPGDGSARHVAYAVQWFAMAAVLAALGLWNWRRAVHRADD